jgi:protein phosphatase
VSLSLPSSYTRRTAQPLRLEAAARSHPGRVRPQNEDAYAIHTDCGLLIVADGMGGHAAGEVASWMAVSSVCDAITEAWMMPCSPSALLVAEIQKANGRIFAAAQQDPATNGMGSTIVGALVVDGHVAIAHIGDSRAYLLRGRHIEQLTEDHTVANQCRLLGIDLPALKGCEHLLTRALGTDEHVDIDVRMFEPLAGDVLLLCSDGLTGMLDARMIASIVGESRSLDVAAEHLVTAANDCGGPDNVTVVLARWKEASGTDEQLRDDEPGPGAVRGSVDVRGRS